MLTKEIISKLYEEKKDFIVVGLTGRTGSGCTEAANLLCKDFKSLDAIKPKFRDFKSKEDRQYNIVYNYAKENWKRFIKIGVSDIITSFILEEDYSSFLAWISDLDLSSIEDSIPDGEDINECKRRFVEKLKSKNLDTDFDCMSRRLLRILSCDDKQNFNGFFKDMCEFSQKLQKTMKDIDKAMYTYIYQLAGNNIRSSGKYNDKSKESSKVFSLIERINNIIKLLRKNEDNKNTMVVIDAIRNPYEAVFLKDRYSAFYLISVNVDDETRIDRLFKLGLNKKEIENLDYIEYPKKDEGFESFIAQDIQSCLELSDIHLNNPDDKERETLKKGLLKYISLIMHPGLISPTDQERCMQVAYTAKLNSGCLSRQVGAVLTDEDYFLRAMGWNDSPEGQIECNLRCLENLFDRSDEVAYSSYEHSEEFQKSISEYLTRKEINIECDELLKGRKFHYCFKDIKNYKDKEKNQVHTRSLHAEENAILLLTRFGGKEIKGGNLFVTASPCELCSKKIYHLGIKKIYYIDPYPGISNNHVLASGYKDIELQLFTGAVGKAYHQLYTQVMPIKDEIAMITGIDFKIDKWED